MPPAPGSFQNSSHLLDQHGQFSVGDSIPTFWSSGFNPADLNHRGQFHLNLPLGLATLGRLEKPSIRRPRLGGDPVKTKNWIPSFAGMTSFSKCPLADARLVAGRTASQDQNGQQLGEESSEPIHHLTSVLLVMG